MSVMFFRMATELANKKAEREALRGVIQQWNANRLDLFELSEPNEVSVADDASTFLISPDYRFYKFIRTILFFRLDRTWSFMA